MLSPEYLDQLPDAVEEIYEEAERDILEDMARRIAKTGKLTDAAEWQYEKLKEMGAEYEYIMQTLQSYLGQAQGELRGIFEDAGVKTLAYDDRIYRAAGLSPAALAESPMLLNILDSGLKQTMGLFKNLTRTTASAGQEQFVSALDRAWMQITSGAFDYQTAIKQAIKDVSRSGLAAIKYPSGHVDHLDVAVRRATLTGVNQTSAKLSLERARQLGTDLVETTAHAGARPSHAVWQGRIFSISGDGRHENFIEATGYGTGPGLCGWNCGHSFFPFIEGVSEAVYSREELDRLNSQTVTYNGQSIPLYDATQKQRQIERQIRRWKRESAAMDAAGLDPSEAKAKIREWQARQRDFVKQTGLKRDYFRERAGKQNLENPLKQRIIRHELPNADAAVIKKEKFTEYALNPQRQPDKAKAFKDALGYAIGDEESLIKNIRDNIKYYEAVPSEKTEFGQLYSVLMRLKGPNGKYANVKTGWIVDNGNETRLTSAYISKKKVDRWT